MEKSVLTDIQAFEIIDNRGMPTLRTTVTTDSGASGRADVPSGSSTGAHEAKELRDGGRRYQGKGVRRAVATVHETILPALKGTDIRRLRDIDATMIELDGTPDKSCLGANAILGVSLASARAGATACNLPLYRFLNTCSHVLPVPQACLVNGGLHAGNALDIQEFCVMPVGAESFATALEMLCDIFQNLRGLLLDALGPSAVNSSEDGGFAPALDRSEQAMDYLVRAVEKAGYADDVVYALDIAAGSFFDPSENIYRFEGQALSAEGMTDVLEVLLSTFPGIVSIEDPLHEDDWEGWQRLTQRFSKTLVVGDDLLATNPGRIHKAISLRAANAALCKVNQIGTLTQAMDAALLARKNEYPCIMSVRSGETEDDLLADVSLALDAGVFKTGGLRGSERGAKYNRFLEIEQELGRTAVYAGRNFKRPV